MKKLVTYLFFSTLLLPVTAQYYLRGQVFDEKKSPLVGAKILVHSEKKFVQAGDQGGFGITVRKAQDSLTITMDGFEPLAVSVRTDQWQTLVLKPTADAVSKYHPKLASYTRDYTGSTQSKTFSGDETYFQLVENDVIRTREFPNTGYSLNVNKASYSNTRRFLNQSVFVPEDAIRIEEMVNYFDLFYRQPPPKEAFDLRTQLTSCPWNKEKQLLYVQVSAQKMDTSKVPPGNYVFLIDVSGSMDMPNRLPLIKASFQLFVKNLRNTDTVTIITYGGYVEEWLKPTSGREKDKIIQAIEKLEASGDTPGEAGLKMAYTSAQRTFIRNGNNRIILATDADFNVGETSEKALDDLVTNQRSSGIYLTCLGVGMGNLKDSKLQTLAKKGNGNYAYLDDFEEAERVLVKEISQTLYTIADDAYVSVQFHPAVVDNYRLIGFDNKKDAISDGNLIVEGGEVGSGSSILAVFEVQAKPAAPDALLAHLQLHYSPKGDTSTLTRSFSIPNRFLPMDSIHPDLRFATAVTSFSLKLKRSKYYKDQSWADIKKLAQLSLAGENQFLKQEFIGLIDKAQKVYGKKMNKKRPTY